MESFSALLVLCEGNSPVTGECPSKRPVMQSFDIFCDLLLNKWLSKASGRRWFETLSRSLWRHCNGLSINLWLRPHHSMGIKPLPWNLMARLLTCRWSAAATVSTNYNRHVDAHVEGFKSFVSSQCLDLVLGKNTNRSPNSPLRLWVLWLSQPGSPVYPWWCREIKKRCKCNFMVSFSSLTLLHFSSPLGLTGDRLRPDFT